jgi:hypothetical protein
MFHQININYENWCITLIYYYLEKLGSLIINQTNPKFIYKIQTTVEQRY